MSTVSDLFRRTGFDTTLNAELLIGADVVVLHLGVMGYGSGFAMVRRDPNEECDEFGRPMFDWRILNCDGDTIANGAQLRDLDGGTHALEALVALLKRLIEFAELPPDEYDMDFNVFDDASRFWLVEYIVPELPGLIEQVSQTVAHLDLIELPPERSYEGSGGETPARETPSVSSLPTRPRTPSRRSRPT